MVRIERSLFGGSIANSAVSWHTVQELGEAKYLKKTKAYQRNKTVFIVPITGWSEFWLHDWLIEHYAWLGYSDLEPDRSNRYSEIKQAAGFYGYPDFLVEKDDRWRRVEVECFSHQYLNKHPPGYADILLCYEETTEVGGPETLNLRRILGCEEIINISEIPQFLHLYDEEFKQEYQIHMLEHERRVREIWK